MRTKQSNPLGFSVCMHICKKTKNTQSEVILTVWEQLYYCTLCKSSSMKYRMVWPQYIRSRCGKALETPFTLFYPRFSGTIFTGFFFGGSLYFLGINLFKSRKTLQGVRWSCGQFIVVWVRTLFLMLSQFITFLLKITCIKHIMVWWQYITGRCG